MTASAVPRPTQHTHLSVGLVLDVLPHGLQELGPAELRHDVIRKPQVAEAGGAGTGGNVNLRQSVVGGWWLVGLAARHVPGFSRDGNNGWSPFLSVCHSTATCLHLRLPPAALP